MAPCPPHTVPARTSQPAEQPLDKNGERLGKSWDPSLRHFLTGSEAATGLSSTHTRAPKPSRKCQVPSKCLISRAKFNLPLPSNLKSPGDLIQVTESAWRQPRGLQVHESPGLPTPSQEAQPLRLTCTRACACSTYTCTGLTCTRVHAHATLTHTFPFASLRGAEPQRLCKVQEMNSSARVHRRRSAHVEIRWSPGGQTGKLHTITSTRNQTPLSLVHGILSWKQIRKQALLAEGRSPRAQALPAAVQM